MGRSFWKIVNSVIEQADILILLLDARLIEETRNLEVEMKVKDAKKPLIYVITKCDLVDKKTLEKLDLKPSVFISSKEYHGTTILRDRILTEGHRAYKDKEVFTVGVLGYPNVGKSSLINAMKGKKAAPTSSVSGFTKGIRKVKSDNKIMFLDTPGVVPYQEKNDSKHALIGTLDFNQVDNQDVIVMELMEKYPGRIEKNYGVPVSSELEETLEAIAQKKNLLKKKGELDIERTAKMILKDWQTGKIK